MADQGVEYEISVKDSTKPGVESAKATVSEGAKAASKNAEDVSNDFKGAFSPMGAITAALTGNFQALSQQLLGLATRLKGVHMSMMQFSIYSALVMGVVKAAEPLAKHFRETAQQADRIKLTAAQTSLAAADKASAAFARNLDEARKNAEALTAAFNRELDALRELTKAQNEFAKAQELALAKSDKERQDIETKYRSIGAHNEREISAQRRAAEREALDGEIERLQKEFENAEKDEAAARKRYNESVEGLDKANGKAGFWEWFWDYGESQKKESASWQSIADKNSEAILSAMKKQKEITGKLADARHRRDMLDVKEEAAQYSDAAAMQTELNEAWQEADEAEKKEIEEIRELAVEAAEEVRDTRLKALAEEQKARMADLREATEAEAAAQQRLAAAKAQVDRAWGWYRNKDSLAAQLEEEKADAAAREQYEKDFDRLRRQRPDWEKAKNLSLDQEAVKRVALARREEESSKEAVAETAENTRRAAASLAAIENMLGEE